MNLERTKEIYSDFHNAVKKLADALDEDVSKGGVVMDGTIKRFEFTFELSWKLARAILILQGVEANTPRAVIKESFRADIIDDGDGWMDMLEDRNKSAHIYDEAIALEIYNRIKEKHYNNLRSFEISSSKFIDTF